MGHHSGCCVQTAQAGGLVAAQRVPVSGVRGSDRFDPGTPRCGAPSSVAEVDRGPAVGHVSSELTLAGQDVRGHVVVAGRVCQFQRPIGPVARGGEIGGVMVQPRSELGVLGLHVQQRVAVRAGMVVADLADDPDLFAHRGYDVPGPEQVVGVHQNRHQPSEVFDRVQVSCAGV